MLAVGVMAEMHRLGSDCERDELDIGFMVNVNVNVNVKAFRNDKTTTFVMH